MARIRTIKPQFFMDEKVASLSHSCALFFVGLWTIADDEGKFRNSPRQLHLMMPIFETRHVQRWLMELTCNGQLRISEDSCWYQVVNWRHQRISKVIQPLVKAAEIKWKPVSIPNPDDTGRRSVDARNGKERNRKGKDSLTGRRSGLRAAEPPKEQLAPLATTAEPSSPVKDFIAVYCDAFKARYGTWPTVGKKGAGIARRIVAEVGIAKAKLCAQAYVAMGDAWFLTRNHDLATLESNLTKVAAYADTGQTITSAGARQAELYSHNAAVVDAMLREDGAS